MANNFYSNLAAVASRLLTDKGQQVTFTRETGETFDPETGSYSGGTESTWNGYGASFDYNRSEIDETVIQTGDIRLIVEAVTTTPQVGDKCTVDSKDYRVMNVMESSPGGTVTHYEVQLRV